MAAYPGTFDPPTVAHLAVAEAACTQAGLARVELVISLTPLGKAPAVPSFEDRLAVLEQVAGSREWLSVRVTDRQLIADVCFGYDAVVMGVDKWLQVVDPAWYGGSERRRDRAVASLPRVLLAPRSGPGIPGGLPPGAVVLDVAPHHGPVSSRLARRGRTEWMLPEAARFDRHTGAWSDPERYVAAAKARRGPASLAPMPGRTPPPQE